MKKILLCLTTICTIFMLTGCGKENISLNLSELSQKIDKLESNEFDRGKAVALIEEKISGLEFIYDFDFKDKLGLELEPQQMDNYSIEANLETKDQFFIIKPATGEKENIKSKLDDYFAKLANSDNEEIANKAKAIVYEEIDDYLVYLMFEGNKDLINDIKKCKEVIFNSLMEVDDDLLEQQFNINKDDVEEYLIKVPMMITSSNSYMILKPKDGKVDTVKQAMDAYMTKLEEQWKTYLPSQYELVQNRLEEEYGDYLIYIISSDNNSVMNAIKNK